MAYTVYLDAGHGGYDNGATDGNRKEKTDNLNLTLAVGEILQNNGVDVGYTRVEDVYDSPLRKAQIANEAGADLFVSIHRNAAEYRNQYNGVQTLIFDNSGIKKEMADAINEALAGVGFKNIGTEIRRDLAVLRRTKMPALLVEAGFIDSDTDNAIFDGNFDDVAQAIAYAILNTLQDNGLVSARRTAAGVNTAGQDNRAVAASAFPLEHMAGRAGAAGSVVASAAVEKRFTQTATEQPESPSIDWQSQDSTQDSIPPVDEEMQIGRRLSGRCVCIDDDDDDDDDDCRPCYVVQTGLYRNYQNALRQRRKMERDGFSSMIQLYKKFYAVVTGYYETEREARNAQRRLRQLGYDTLIRTVR